MAPNLAIVLPGRAYGPLGPALRLPRLALEELGYSTAVVEYAPGEKLPANHEEWEDFHRVVDYQARSFIEEAQPSQVTFLAKSLGTVALAALAHDITGGTAVAAIWLTPLFGIEAVRLGAERLGWRSLLVAGGADDAHQPSAHEAVRKALGAASLVLPKSDHMLEVPGDVRLTLDGFSSLTGSVTEFAAPSVPSSSSVAMSSVEVAVLDQFNLVVSDMEASVAFYRRLGLAIPDAGTWQRHHRSAQLRSGLDLDLDSTEFARHWDTGWRGGTGVLGFKVNGRQRVDEVYADLTMAGYRGQQPPYDAFWGARYAVVEDPDGNAVGIMSQVDQAKRAEPGFLTEA